MIIDENQYNSHEQREPQVMPVGRQMVDEVNIVRQSRADNAGTEVRGRVEVGHACRFRSPAHVVASLVF